MGQPNPETIITKQFRDSDNHHKVPGGSAIPCYRRCPRLTVNVHEKFLWSPNKILIFSQKGVIPGTANLL